MTQMRKNPVNDKIISPELDHEGAHGAAIETRDLVKCYRGGKNTGSRPALDSVSLSIPKGSIYGLLGPNGAGKSTFINILAGLVVKTSGHVRVWDFDLDRSPRQVRAALGVVPQEINYDPFFTPAELLDLHAGLYGVPKAQRHGIELLDALGLADKANAYTRNLSGGMKRRLLIAKALVHAPPILILDEPTAGVDVDLRRQLWAYVRKLNESGTTIVLTTHYLEEAQSLCDYIAIIDQGQVVTAQPKEQLLRRLDCKRLTIRPAESLAAIPPGLGAFDPELDENGALALSYKPSQTPMSAVLARLQEAGVEIADLTTHEADLEEIFLQLTGKSAKLPGTA